MKIFYKVLLAVVLLPSLSLAQSNYKPGYAVTLKGDTLRGFIDYREWDINPASINFKTNLADNKTQKLNPHVIGSFNIPGLEEYSKYAGKISMDETDHNRLSNGRDTSFKIDTVFLRVLQKGTNVALYSYFDGIKIRFYINDKFDHLPKELVYHIYVNADETLPSAKTVIDNTYMRQLYVMAEKYNVLTDALQNDIQHANYSKADILAITSKINGISKAEYEKNYNDKTKIRFFAGAGINNTTTAPFKNYKKAGGKTSSSYSPLLSFGANLFGNPNAGKLMIIAEMIISGNKYNSAYIYTGSPYVPVRYTFDQFKVAIAPQIVYNFYNTDNFKIHANAGVALSYSKFYNASYDLNYAATQASNVPINSKYFFNPTFPFLLKLGMRFKNIDIFADYFTSALITGDNYFQVNTYSTQLGIDYIFK